MRNLGPLVLAPRSLRIVNYVELLFTHACVRARAAQRRTVAVAGGLGGGGIGALEAYCPILAKTWNLRTCSVNGSLLIDGSRWFCQRSRHCFPVRPPITSAMVVQLIATPVLRSAITAVAKASSSSIDHGRRIVAERVDMFWKRFGSAYPVSHLRYPRGSCEPSRSHRRANDTIFSRPYLSQFPGSVNRNEARILNRVFEYSAPAVLSTTTIDSTSS